MRRLRLSQTEYDDVVSVVLEEFFCVEDGRVFNKRLMEEYEHASDRHEIAKDAAQKRWKKPKSLKNNETDTCESNATESNANQNQNQNYINKDMFEDDCIQEPTPEEQFEEWYRHYGKKVGRGQAVKAFKSAIKKVSLDQLVSAAKAYSTSFEGKEKTYMKNPSTWLNGECWGDEGISTTECDLDSPKAKWGEAIDKWQKNGKRGPMPTREEFGVIE